MDFSLAKRNKKLDQWILISLIFTLCLGLNYFAAKLDLQFDLSKKSKYSISQESSVLLNKLEEPVEIVVTIKDRNNLPKITSKFLHDLKILLQAIENAPTKQQIRVTMLDVDSPKGPPPYLTEYKINDPNLIIVASKSGGQKTLFRYNSEGPTNPYDTGTPFRSKDSAARQAIWESEFYSDWKESYNGVLEPTKFRGEETLVRAILEVAGKRNVQNTAYFTNGHGEKSPFDFDKENGYSELKRMMEDRNIKVSSIDLSLVEKVPSDASILIIAGPKGTFQDQEVSHIRSFLNNRGGKVILAVDPVEELSILDRPAFGLRPVLKEWGIRCHDMLIHDPGNQNFDFFSGAYILRTYLKNNRSKVVSQLAEMGLSIQSSRCRPVEAFTDGSLDNYRTIELLFSSKSSIGLSGWTQRKNPPEINPLLDLQGNIPVIAISEKKESRESIFIPDGKIAVLGSSNILSNKYLTQNSGNQLLGKNLIYWLNESTEMFEIQPRVVDSFTISMQESEFDKFLYAITIVPGVIALLGIFVGWLRKEL
ncbi:GldG family protein [Opitutales bacterium]|nr:GldG family protein [Opitutales bacterium]MDA8990677.1 GldG family protein [Opitutales bacterium]